MLRPLRLLSSALALSFGVLLAGPVLAASEAPFTEQAFVAAQQGGRPILVDISAWWCPVCAKQRPIVERLSKDRAFQDLVILRVNYDSQKDVVRQMRAQKQSTLVVFHGKREVGRSVGETNAEKIKALLLEADQ